MVGSGGLNLLINNAGLLPANRDLEAVTPEDMMAAFKVNCVGPLFFAKERILQFYSAIERVTEVDPLLEGVKKNHTFKDMFEYLRAQTPFADILGFFF